MKCLKFLKKIDPAWIILAVLLFIMLIQFWVMYLEPRLFRENFAPMLLARDSAQTVTVEYGGAVTELDYLNSDVYAYLTIAKTRLPAVIPEKEEREHMTLRYQNLTVDVWSNGEDSLYVTVDKGFLPISWKLSGYGNFHKILTKLYQQTENKLFNKGNNT